MEVAGLVLGGLPIALLVMDNYHRCLQVTKDYWRYKSTIKLLRSHIFVQHEQLQITLRSIGLTSPNSFRLEEFIRHKYPDKHEAFVDIILHMDGMFKRLMNDLDVDINGKPRWTEEPPERANWEWKRVKRSFGTSSRQKLIQELQFWNNALKVCFEKSELPLDSDTPNLTVESIRAKFNSQWCNEIRTQASHIHEAVAKSWRCQCGDHQASLKLLWHGDQLLKPPCELHVALCSNEIPSGNANWQDVLFEQVKNVTPQEPQPPPPQALVPDVGRRKSIKAWLKPSFDSPQDHDMMATQPFPMPSSSSATANSQKMIPSPDTDCLCHFLHQEHQQTGLLSGLWKPIHIRKRLEKQPQATTVTPIRAVLAAKPNQFSDSLLLSRRDRFGLAAAVAWAVLYLAESPWMASQWDTRPELYLFSESHNHMWRHYPSLPSVFQEWSHPDATSTSDDRYKAPGSSFVPVRNKTLFALGVLLIELCLNQPFEQLREEYRNDRLSSVLSTGPPADDYVIATHQMQNVYLDAGDFYGDAVQRCIRCEFPGRDNTKNFHFEQFRRDFFSYVIAPVQATYALLPSSGISI
ncbi:hypothetical protein PG984_004555 [Apiospora sp. TS-2023a]